MIRNASGSEAAAFAFGAIAIVTLAVADGGFFAQSWRFATLGFAAAAAIALVLRTRIAIATADVALLTGLVAFTSWVALSAVWADERSQALLEAERSAVYVIGVLAAVLVVARAAVPYLLGGIAAAVTVVAIVSLAQGKQPHESLEGPIGYANALGILAVVAIVIVVAAFLRAPRLVSGAIVVGAGVPLVAALILSGSRGSALALAVGLVAALPLAPRGVRLAFGLLAVVTAVVVGVAFARNGPPFSLGDRPQYWRVASSQFENNPIVGAGAGAFHDYWVAHRPDPASLDTPEVLDAHSLYVETLAELGLVGLVLLALTLSVPLVVAWRSRGDPIAAQALPGYAAFVVHAGLDWDWEMPVVTLAGLFCGAAVVRAGSEGRAKPASPAVRVVAAAVAVTLGALAVTSLLR